MPEFDAAQQGVITRVISPQEIAEVRAHPAFPELFRRASENSTGWVARAGRLRYVAKDRGGLTIGLVALGLYGTREGLTAGRLRALCVDGGICSAGRLESHLAVLRRWGALIPLEKIPGQATRFAPGPDYLAYFRAYVTSALNGLALLEPQHAPLAKRLQGFDLHRFIRYVMTSSTINPPLTHPDRDPTLLLFAERDDGLPILNDLVVAQAGSSDGAAPVSIAELSRRHAVSRAHVLKLLRDGDEAGVLTWRPDLRRAILPPKLIDRLECSVAVSAANTRQAARALAAIPVAPLKVRPAVEADIPALRGLMNRSIGELQQSFLSPAQVSASFDIMGLDTQLIADGTYLVVEAGSMIAGCGGWSRRATLFGGDHTGGRDAALLDPAAEAARIRAMYTHPDFTRRGVGRLIIETCEAAAAAEGFRRCEMAATLAGEPLYRSCGYEVIEPFDGVTARGAKVPLKRMGKAISPA